MGACRKHVHLTRWDIEVQGDGTTAVILTVPENEYQFAAGDEKWSDIESTGDGEYSFQDLVREENTGATSYVEGIITVSEDGNTLVMTFPTTGTTQEWVRADGSRQLPRWRTSRTLRLEEFDQGA
jgi:hypothetical protein